MSDIEQTHQQLIRTVNWLLTDNQHIRSKLAETNDMLCKLTLSVDVIENRIDQLEKSVRKKTDPYQIQLELQVESLHQFRHKHMFSLIELKTTLHTIDKMKQHLESRMSEIEAHLQSDEYDIVDIST